MKKRSVIEWISQPKIRKILFSFIVAKTPRQVEKLHGIRKFKVKPYLENQLLQSLNPDARKGRYYTLTSKARKLLGLPDSKQENKDWNIFGWIMASPRQRLAVFNSLDSAKRTSEEIRKKSKNANPLLTRINTKQTLKELIGKDLAETELSNRRRYYWISEKGKLFVNQQNKLPGLLEKSH